MSSMAALSNYMRYENPDCGDAFGDPRKQPPELALWADCLRAAFWDWLRCRCLGEKWVHRADLQNAGTFAKAYEESAPKWFASNNTRVGSFLFCCYHLDIEPRAVRRRLSDLERLISNMSETERLDFYKRYWCDCNNKNMVKILPAEAPQLSRYWNKHNIAPRPMSHNTGTDVMSHGGSGRPHRKCKSCRKLRIIAAKGMCDRCLYRMAHGQSRPENENWIEEELAKPDAVITRKVPGGGRFIGREPSSDIRRPASI